MQTDDWDYQRICSVLKRYSFDSKMRIAHKYSCRLLSKDAADPNKRRSMPLDSTIETFVMLAVAKEEWKSQSMTDKEFCRCASGIVEHQHPFLKDRVGPEFSKWLIASLSATQFYLQGNEQYRLSRFYEYFTFENEEINMPAEMKEKFGLSYEDLALPIFIVWLAEHRDPTLKLSLPENYYSQLQDLYPQSFKLLTISRGNYKQELDRISSDENDYLYCLRPSYKWPFIEYKGVIYNPTPHLLIRAVTTSLMFRLTENNDQLRQAIGKQVLEPYLFKLIESSNAFIEVKSEQIYGDDQRTSDVMACTDEDIICFDSKSFTPQINLRIFNESSFNNAVRRIVDGVEQVYNQIRYKFNEEYKYLCTSLEPDRSNIFGIVVLGDDPYIPLESIYGCAAERLGIDTLSPEYDWLRGHVGIVDIDLLEHQLLDCDNLHDALRKNMVTGRFGDHWFLSSRRKRDYHLPVFISENITSIIKTLKTAGDS